MAPKQPCLTVLRFHGEHQRTPLWLSIQVSFSRFGGAHPFLFFFFSFSSGSSIPSFWRAGGAHHLFGFIPPSHVSFGPYGKPAGPPVMPPPKPPKTRLRAEAVLRVHRGPGRAEAAAGAQRRLPRWAAPRVVFFFRVTAPRFLFLRKEGRPRRRAPSHVAGATKKRRLPNVDRKGRSCWRSSLFICSSCITVSEMPPPNR